MLTMRLSGTLTAVSPIFITRPEQGDVPLTMNVVRDQSLVRTYAIPGETIKGLLRQKAYALCVDAASADGAELTVSLAGFYRQTAGGIGFTADKQEIGADARLRPTEPILSLFGAATPRMTGKLIVQHALAQPVLNASGMEGTGLPEGTRRDGLTTTPEFGDLLGAADRELWSRQSIMVSEASEAGRRVDDAKRILGRARRTPGVDLKLLEAALVTAEEDLARMKAMPDFQHSVQRPIPVKPAAPAGTVYDHGLVVEEGSPEEIGLLLAALEAWNLAPRIGGGRTTGYGLLRGEYLIELLSGAGLRRDRAWRPAGAVHIAGEGAAVETGDPDVQGAIEAWRTMEGGLREATGIFSPVEVGAGKKVAR